MGDGVKEEPSRPAAAQGSEKTGWLKKSSGKFLSTYKDRYILLDRTFIAIYENEELTTCLEKLDLENYDRCHELKSPFKKKHRLVLLRSPKSPSKVHDVKLQVQTPEEKEDWIKALSEGINKAKNKILDEVKVEQNCPLDHVTRSRPVGNRNRRPPTRIHMREIANQSSDGILRLDLDGNVTVLNGLKPTLASHSAIAEENAGEESTIQKVKPPVPPSTANKPCEAHEEPRAESEEPGPQKKTLVPPMPPSTANKPCEAHEEPRAENEEPGPQKKTLVPPMPPSTANKPCEAHEEPRAESEEPGPQKKTLVPPMPPSTANKPCEANEEPRAESEEPGPQKKTLVPPMPPSKDSKPGFDAKLEVETEIEVDHSTLNPPSPPSKQLKPHQPDSAVVKVADGEDAQVDAQDLLKNEEIVDNVISKEPEIQWKAIIKPQVVMWDVGTLSAADDVPDQISKQTSEDTGAEPQRLSTPDAVKKSPKPPAPPKKKPMMPPKGIKKENSAPQSDPEELLEKDAVKVAVSAEDLEKKSVDSGQHSAEESDIGDQGTQKLDTKLDRETSEEDLEPSNSRPEVEESSVETPSTTPEMPDLPSPRPSFTVPRLTKPSKSVGDLLAEEMEEKEPVISARTSASSETDLHSKVTEQLQQTKELLNAITTGQAAGLDLKAGTSPELLLTTAMEKLQKADQFLREAKSFKDLKKGNRMSLDW